MSASDMAFIFWVLFLAARLTIFSVNIDIAVIFVNLRGSLL